MGLQPGPTFKTIMQAVFDAKLNGLLKTKKEELAFIRNHAGKFQH
jgi:tRNA nucleotidyltransferase (CCA-adding enzyme)